MLHRTTDITVGLVQYLVHRDVYDHPQVARSGNDYGEPPPAKTRSFVCMAVYGDQSLWVPMTTTRRAERLLIRPEWRWGGSRVWQSTRPVYLTDGAVFYTGPLQAFLDLTVADHASITNAGYLLQDGVVEVNAEMARQRHRRAA